MRRARYNHVVIVQDFAEQGDLLRLLKRYGGVLPERVVVNEVLRPLLHALAYMHGGWGVMGGGSGCGKWDAGG